MNRLQRSRVISDSIPQGRPRSSGKQIAGTRIVEALENSAEMVMQRKNLVRRAPLQSSIIKSRKGIADAMPRSYLRISTCGEPRTRLIFSWGRGSGIFGWLYFGPRTQSHAGDRCSAGTGHRVGEIPPCHQSRESLVVKRLA